MRRIASSISAFLIKHIKTSIILIYDIGIILITAIFHPLIPLLVGYPREVVAINNFVGISYNLQFVIIGSVLLIVGTTMLLILLRDVEKWQSALYEDNLTLLKKIRDKCINIPYNIFIIQIGVVGVIIPISGLIVCTVNNIPLSVYLKVCIVIFSFSSMIAVFSHILTKKLLTKILLATYSDEGLTGRRIKLKYKFFLQVLPIIIVSILFISALSLSKLTEQTGNITFKLCKFELSKTLTGNSDFKSSSEAFMTLKKIKIKNIRTAYFLTDRTNGKTLFSDKYIPDPFFEYFLKNPSKGNRIFSQSYEVQGLVHKITVAGKDYFAGIKFESNSNDVTEFFLLSILTLLALNIFVLYYFSKSLSDEISLVAKSLTEISKKDRTDLNKKLAVISNDEIGDLVVAFNKIREREIEYENLKDEFIVNISHELRTPINIIFSSVQLMELFNREGSRLNSEDLNLKFYSIKQNCLRLIRLINNLIDITTADAGFIKLNLQRLDIISFVEKIVMSVREYAVNKGLNFYFETETDEKVMVFDPYKIEAVILNLLSNAIKFTKEGGNVTVRIYEDGERLMISFRDTGIGIPENKKEVIFERFRQVEQSLVRNFEGSGIGLSLTKLFVELHKGKISVESEEGVGSEFIVELPVDIETSDENLHLTSLYNTSNSSGINRIDIEFSDINLPKEPEE
jgi:signal transduction histidine kinase